MVSAMMKAAAPMMGGMICPLVEAATSMAPALTAGIPILRITGMVKVPVVTTLAMDDPEIAAILADHGEGYIEKVLAGTRLFQKRAEQHEQKHEAHGNIDGDAEDRFTGEPLISDQPFDGDALMGDDVGHGLPEDGKYQKDTANNDQG